MIKKRRAFLFKPNALLCLPNVLQISKLLKNNLPILCITKKN